jgi:hypothetical protein
MNRNIIKIIALVVAVFAIIFVCMQVFSPKKTSAAYVIRQLEGKMELPKNQSPRVARVETPEILAQLRSQAFFQNTQLKDALVVYPDRVVVYRPSTDKVVSMGSLDPNKSAQLFGGVTADGSSENTTTTTSTDQKASAIEVRNGTTVSGLAKKFATKFANVSGLEKPVTGNAVNKNYTDTVLIITGSPSAQVVADLEKTLSLKATKTLPSGETASKADITIIVGSK